MKFLTNYSMQEINCTPITIKNLKSCINKLLRVTQAVEKNAMILTKLEASKEQQLKSTV